MDHYVIAQENDDSCTEQITAGIAARIGPEGVQLIESDPALSDLLPDSED